MLHKNPKGCFLFVIFLILQIYIVRRGSALTALHKMVTDKKLLPLCLGGEVSNEEGFYEGVEEAAMKDTTLQDLIANIQKEVRIQNY